MCHPLIWKNWMMSKVTYLMAIASISWPWSYSWPWRVCRLGSFVRLSSNSNDCDLRKKQVTSTRTWTCLKSEVGSSRVESRVSTATMRLTLRARLIISLFVVVFIHRDIVVIGRTLTWFVRLDLRHFFAVYFAKQYGAIIWVDVSNASAASSTTRASELFSM